MKYFLIFLPLFTHAQCSPTLSDMLQDRRKWNEVTFIDPPDVSLGAYLGALTTTPLLTIVDTTTMDTFPPMLTIEHGGWTVTENDVVVLGCVPFEEFTEWQLELLGSVKISDLHEGPHDWVYAEHSDVNQSWLDVQTAMYCPCGCPKTDNEARICRVCLVHQTRKRTHGYKPRVEESEYIKLKKKAKQ